MPTSDSLETRSSRSNSDKKPSWNSTVSISAPQRRRPVMHSTASKENTSTRAQKKPSSAHRPAKHSRLSDRWPVLNRIIRASKSAPASRDQPPHTGDLDSSSDTEDEDECVITVQPINSRTISMAVQYKLRVIHPSSPKFPSPLSGVRPIKRLLLTRHNYFHRGYSQSALYHQRELWRKRKCEWDDYEHMLFQAGVTLEEAYGGIAEDFRGFSRSLPPHLKNGPWCRSSSTTFQQTPETKPHTQALVNPATFPRLGDLSTVRDPFLISVDTWFADFPLWTLSKLVWIYDVNHRSGTSAHQHKSSWLSNTFVEDFDFGNSSADTSLSSYTDTSGSTLVSTVSTACRRSKDFIEAPLHFESVQKNTLPSSSSFDSITSSHGRIRTWETCWFSRWEILYNQISLAADIAASSGDPSANGSKEAARVILTTPGVLYDPHCSGIDGRGMDSQEHGSAGSRVAETRSVVPIEEEDDDYGDIICWSESKYRLGAHVDPLSMFATAATEYLNPFLPSDASPEDSNAVASHLSRDYAAEIAGGLQQLALCY